MNISDRFRKGYKRLVGGDRRGSESSIRRVIKETEVFPGDDGSGSKCS